MPLSNIMSACRYCVAIVYPLSGTAYLSHRGRSSWSRRVAQRHAADVRAGRTGIRVVDLDSVDVVPDDAAPARTQFVTTTSCRGRE